jgi:hypothetical protein
VAEFTVGSKNSREEWEEPSTLRACEKEGPGSSGLPVSGDCVIDVDALSFS